MPACLHACIHKDSKLLSVRDSKRCDESTVDHTVGNLLATPARLYTSHICAGPPGPDVSTFMQSECASAEGGPPVI